MTEMSIRQQNRLAASLREAGWAVQDRSCGAVEEVEAGLIGAAFEEDVRKGSSYEGVNVSVVAEGICRACAGEAESDAGETGAADEKGAA